MTPERWRQVTEVFHAARARDASARATYLDHACAGDRVLREEVDAMLAAHHDPGGFGSRPVSGSIDAGRRLKPGAMVGAYRIDTLIGAGGMGEVYRARDTKLGRDVAIKVLPAAFTSDLERLARFEREARMLAALNHPHIGAIYGLEEIDGVRALVLELVEGPTLADRVAAGPTPVKEALSIARQIAEALEAAHEKGIIHRDLKPANVKVTPDGAVKVLDFGLAKAFVGDGGGPDLSQSPTVSVGGTCEGTILGTPTYMSPEQARGQAVDKRTDIWAFGCVLYEMLARTRAFRGETVSETLADVLKSEPLWTALPPETPAALRNIVRRCLEKDPRQRVHDIADVRLALEGAFETAGVEATTVSVARLRVWQRPTAAALIAVSLVATAGLAVWTLMRPAPAAPIRLTVAPPVGETVGNSLPGSDVAISPDGTRIVFVSGGSPSQLYVRGLDRLESQPLEGLGSSLSPFMSPDGNSVGFFELASSTLKKVSVNGGPSVTLGTVVGAAGAIGGGSSRGASWGPDDTIVFATNDPATGLFRVSAGGSKAEVLTTPNTQKGEADHWWPEILPGGEAVLFTILPTTGGIANARIAVLNLRTGEQKVLVPGGSYPRYMPTGHIVYGVAGTLRAVAFDLRRLEVRSDPVPVLQRVVTKGSGAASFSVAQNGSLVYLAGDVQAGAGQVLVWVDRQGREEPLKAPRRAYFYPRISPDGTKVAVDIRDQEDDIWVWDLARATLRRLTFDPGLDRFPVWTPDGRRIAFSSMRAGASNLFWQAADGTGPVERLTESANEQNPTSFSPAGTPLVFYEVASTTARDIAVLSLEGERRATPLVQTTFEERDAVVSADGRWVAYGSNESGQFEVYVRPFPKVDGGRWQVSTGGGMWPLWARSGRELFYLVLPGRMMAVPIQSGPTFAAGNPQVVFEGRYFTGGGRTYDVSPDGRRFLMIKDAPQTGDTSMSPQLIVVQNWQEELKRLVPTR